MKQDVTLIQNSLPKIKTSTWYRQRFDACPHFMFFLGDSHISSIQDTKYPFGQRIAYAGFSKNRADWYHSLEELEFTASHIIEKAKTNPNISREMIEAFHSWQESFYQACEKLRATDLTKLSNLELLETYNNLADIYTKKLNSSPLIDGFALSTDTLIASKIKAHLEASGVGDKFVEYFAILTAPVFTSFLQQEEIALLHLAKTVNTDPDKKEELLKTHQQNYFWLQNNYVKDHILPIEFFANRVEEYEKTDIDARITEIQVLAEDHKKDKVELIAKLNLPSEIQTLLKITDDFNWWQDERKKGTFWATHYFSILLEEFARRTGYTIDQLKYAFPPEMADILAKKIPATKLDQRFSYCIILWVKDNYDVITDQSLIEELDKIGTGEYKHSTQDLKGFVASKGKAQGKVKILESAEEIHKIEAGDILVAVMTRPDYLPAMQKAAAFVTDEGGITSHAAIVAREMKKPCIIGTKIATKVLKDGDLVEVDADRGVVRIIK